MSSAELRFDHNSRNAKKGSQDLLGGKDFELDECERDNLHEPLRMLESELKVLSAESVHVLKLCGGSQLIEEFYSQTYCDDVAKLDHHLKGYNPSAYNYKDRQLHMLQNIVGDGSQRTPVNTNSGGFMEFDYYKVIDPGQTKKACSELDSEWIGVQKAEPWWRTADKELAASGSPNSSGCIAYNDHSWRQCLGSESYNCSNQVSMAEKESVVTPNYCPGQHPSQSQQKILCVGKGCLTRRSGQPVSGDDNLSIANVLSAETQPGSSDLSKTQLLEALCHSQTRAREAEQLAQQAYNEKEHVIKLFFRQASHLFAYRQWLQILQLEALVLQLRKKDEQDSINYSTFFPVIPSKGRKLKKLRYNKPIKRKSIGKGKCKINKSAVAFALGLGLAGVGLLLGWTMGWLFPAL
ncbi:uncharacterized protein LOC129894311 [Solanum dulcamara]|uniref:uncharacterized protein LOC129894311 n=1 Tax=Solanum dulcamara TaxID=45834 RepID=UPI002485A897|nr:uncharacterized protein LOC129894311 [Solanum dulcamara]XP_055825917.1 uncharacterized protein LOC129894311 [Solanum dulcamara]XP_055825918.1 uncharacterized protein LOC129894311 [Solanum dulcamara]XP_055825920.1 uncharacterized protein LOC129894311 [Solanum dulcamara]XP_055825921.1 uncharacterized protein LOC129894311 [Solanum dulcamara]XP_055825922.1 uncharacterized protein LOC129894311 [Solanum dulcamara]XP_055825923.1 uncharacterized protein LOC129894311 [Solanum dulcamara]XP_05582592